MVVAALRDPVFERDSFYYAQRFRLVGNEYDVATLAEDGKSGGDPVCYVRQKRFKLKEELWADRDDSQQQRVFGIKARKRFDPTATYDITDPVGAPVGLLRKRFGSSLLRSTWEVEDTAGVIVATARERSLAVALFRRFVGLVPVVGDFADWLPIPYHFDFRVGEERIGGLSRILGIRDRYRLEVTGDPERAIDRRLFVALAICLDALQAR